jgi:hypothetical protein
MILTNGSFKARACSPVDFGKSSQQETPGVSVSIRLEEGPHKGTILEWKSYLTEKAKPRTVESLVLMGFDGEDPTSVMKNEIIAVLENETNEYVNDKGEKRSYTETRIKWINDPGRTGGAKFLPLTDSEKAVIAGDIRAAVAAHKAANAPPPTVDPAQMNGPKPKF